MKEKIGRERITIPALYSSISRRNWNEGPHENRL